MKEQILETWRINNRVNLFLLNHIPEAAFAASLSKRGGRDIARQFAHVHMNRVWRLESYARKIEADLIPFEKGETPGREKLLQAFGQSADVMEKYLAFCINNGGKVSNFKRGVVAMLGYYISHEAHHRGHILLTIKQSGFKLPDSLRWGLWEWNKI